MHDAEQINWMLKIAYAHPIHIWNTWLFGAICRIPQTSLHSS